MYVPFSLSCAVCCMHAAKFLFEPAHLLYACPLQVISGLSCGCMSAQYSVIHTDECLWRTFQVEREAQNKKKAEEDKRNQEKQAKKDAEAKVSSGGGLRAAHSDLA